MPAPPLPPGVAHPSGQTPDGPPPERPQITPYPPDPPTITGAALTQSVFQAGP